MKIVRTQHRNISSKENFNYRTKILIKLMHMTMTLTTHKNNLKKTIVNKNNQQETNPKND